MFLLSSDYLQIIIRTCLRYILYFDNIFFLFLLYLGRPIYQSLTNLYNLYWTVFIVIYYI